MSKIEITHRICKSCGLNKPLEELHKTVDKGKLYYRPFCHACWLIRRRELRQKPAHIPYGLQASRKCDDCGLEFPTDQFPWKNKGKNQRVTACRPCWNARKRAYNAALPTGFRSLQERPQRLRYAEANREKINAKNREYNRTHPEQRLAIFRRRKQRLKAGGKIDRQAVIDRDGLTCYLCRKSLTDRSAGIDHVIPLCKGGTNDTNNLRVACRKCNSHKGISLLDDLHNFPYFQRLGFTA